MRGARRELRSESQVPLRPANSKLYSHSITTVYEPYSQQKERTDGRAGGRTDKHRRISRDRHTEIDNDDDEETTMDTTTMIIMIIIKMMTRLGIGKHFPLL